MIHPLLNLLASQPHLLAEHAQGYADLVADETARVSIAWKRQAVLTLAALCALAVAVVLGGVAVMLWAAVPAGDLRAPWALIVVPLVPLVAAIGCYSAARADPPLEAFAILRQQMKADIGMLREVSARR